MPSGEEQEESRGSVSPEGGGDARRLWPLAFLLTVFFLAGGYIAVNMMRDSAHKLAGGDDYRRLSADSAVYDAGRPLPGNVNIFSYEEPRPEGPAARPAPADNKRYAPAARQQGDLTPSAPSAPSQAGGQWAGVPGETGRSGLYPGAQSAFARMQVKGTFITGGHGVDPPKTSGAAADPQAAVSPAAAGAARKDAGAGAPAKSAGTSVLSSLKGVFFASLHGARIASQDSAKTWIAKNFDNVPEYDTALQYDENVRAKLDKINPNSIPKFLRDQTVTADDAKRLYASDVNEPEVDKPDTKEALKEDTAYQRKKAFSDMAGGMLNGMYAGLGTGGGSGVARGEDGETSSAEDPSGDPDLGNVDEFGNTTLDGGGGLRYIFSPEGEILGCDSQDAQMCLLPGNGGCPAGLVLN